MPELGVAAHWRYKENGYRDRKGRKSDAAEIDDMAWMRQLLDWQREAADPGEFLESLRYDLAVKEIFVFTPKGDVITLPSGSTPVDFAYAVHTEVGHRCIGARVNGRLVALERELENGEVVEVFTSKAPNAGPSKDWQNFVVSPRAKETIASSISAAGILPWTCSTLKSGKRSASVAAIPSMSPMRGTTIVFSRKTDWCVSFWISTSITRGLASIAPAGPTGGSSGMLCHGSVDAVLTMTSRRRAAHSSA